jgi:DNA-binding LacI/PurR family transcriptional regulator
MKKPSSPYPAGMVTLQDIADRCGVQKNAVSRALRGLDRVSSATRARVLQVAAELGYNPAQHDAARRLVARRNGQMVRTHVIALHLPLPTYGTPPRYFNEIYYGLLQACKDAGYSALITTTELMTDAPVVLQPPFHRGDVDGLITLAKPFACYPLYAALRALPSFGPRPILSLMHSVRGANFVGADDQGGSYAAASHLLNLGHRHLLLFVDPVQSSIETARIAGVRDAFYEYGLDPAPYLNLYPLPRGARNWLDPDSQYFTSPDGQVPEWELSERRQLANYLDAHPEITALLSQNDTNARHAWYTLTAMGRRIPEDISLIGFDDTDPFVDDQGHNLLTSIQLPLYEIGRTAVNTLINHIENPELPDEEIILPTSLALRASTGMAPAG